MVYHKLLVSAALAGAAVVLLLKSSSRHEQASPVIVQPVITADLPTIKHDHEPEEIRLSACTNDDAVVRSKLTIWTMLVDAKPGYVDSAVKLIKSAKRHSYVPFDAMLLELAEKPLSQEAKDTLREHGWGVCTMPRLAPPDEEATFPHFRDQFSKFRLWQLHELDTAVYLDADTYIVGDISGLLTFRLDEGKKIGVGRDYFAARGGWQQTFNMGVFVIHPSDADYELLMSYHRGDKPLNYNKHWSEQAFLNALWPTEWQNIGFEYNANLALYKEDLPFWKEREGNIRVVHYTMIKPWKKCGVSPFAEICKWWAKEL
ncbi:Galactinol synthase 7 [Diplonema papillatum]|nr:Galactinol synthase 7 [Diplonema papillatum]